MQHHPGSWYIPWGVPLQKMLAVPMHPTAAAAAAASGYPHSHQPQQGATAVQVPAPSPQQHQVAAAAAAAAAQQHQNYQFNPAAAAALHHHSAAALQSLHPAAAAAMFTPLSLRAFLSPPHNHHLGLTQQPMTTAGVQQQPPPQTLSNQTQSQLTAMNLNVGLVPIRQATSNPVSNGSMLMQVKKVIYIIILCFYESHNSTELNIIRWQNWDWFFIIHLVFHEIQY